MDNRFYLNRFLATGIGSLPHTDPKEACLLILKYLSEGGIPYWPQLPRRSFKENMYVQYSQGLPGVIIDEGAKRIYINTAEDSYAGKLEAVYENYLAGDVDYFAITKDYASGFFEFLSHQESIVSCGYIKGQIIGPISFGLTVTDQDKKAVIYNQEFCDCLLKALAMKATWQIARLRAFGSKTRIIIFIDEPYLASLGSSYFSISPENVARMLNEIIESIHKQGAYAGIHCCGNTDWPVILKTDVDILSFDACNYLDTLLIYKEELEGFKRRGGCLAWGIVPSAADEKLPAVDALLERMVIRTGEYSLVTPACGLSGVSIKMAEEALDLSLRLAEALPRA